MSPENDRWLRGVIGGPAGFGELALDGVLLDVDREVFEISGLRRDQLIGLPLNQTYWFSHSRQAQSRLSAALERARNGEVVRYDEEARLGDDRFMTVELMLTPVRDAGGGICRLRVAAVDVTERKRRESEIGDRIRSLELTVAEQTAALQDSDRRYATLFEMSPDALIICDEQARILDVNSHAQALFGFHREELVGRPVEMLQPENQRLAFTDHWHNVVVPRSGRNAEGRKLHGLRKDGSIFPVDIRLAPMPSKQGLEVLVSVRDMSDRVGLEEASRRQQEMMQRVVDQIPIMVICFDPDGEIQWVNRQFEAILGWSLEDMKQADTLKRVHPDAGERERAANWVSAASGSWIEFQPVAKDGRVVESSWAGVRLSDGRRIGFGRDLSQSKASEELFRKLLEVAPDAMVIADGAGRIVLVNMQTLSLFGYERQELLNRPIEFLMPQRYRAEHMERWQRYLQHPDVRTMGVNRELHGLRKDRSEFRVAIRVSPLAIGEGMLVCSVIQDVTARETILQALRDSDRLLNEAQSLAHLGFWKWDIAADSVTWSAELLRIHGVGSGDFERSLEKCLALVHPADRDATRRTIEAARQHGSQFQTDLRIVRPDGEIRHLINYGESITDASGRVVSMFGSSLDVTDQKHTELALREAATQLRLMSRKLVIAQESERRRLAAQLHDRLGQDLTALSINLTIASRLILLDQAELARRMHDSSVLLESTSAFVEGVLDELRPPLLDEEGPVSALRLYCDSFSRRTEIAARVESRGISRRIGTESEMSLFRIAQEALNNVAKHASARTISITFDWSGASVLLEIADDGAGFDPGAPRRQRGLGLVTMRERAQAVGGHMDVLSTPGAGTRIRVTLSQ